MKHWEEQLGGFVYHCYYYAMYFAQASSCSYRATEERSASGA